MTQKFIRRHSIRLKGYDYSQAGAYFVTIVAWQREMLFGEIVDGEMVLNGFGKIVCDAWFDLPESLSPCRIGAFVVMPNHVHGIVLLIDDGGFPLRNGSRGGSSNVERDVIVPDGLHAGMDPLPTNQTRPYVTAKRHGLSEIVRAFKSFSARRINWLRNSRRHSRLAAQLLRTHHPQRTRNGQDFPLHRIQPNAVGGR